MIPAAQLTLGEKQRLFAQLVGALLRQIVVLGYECTLGEAYRTPEQAALDAAKGIGIKNSEHCKRLAIDLNLFRAGVYLTASEDYKPIGDWWKTQHDLCRWGGDFVSNPDGNHFSMEDAGVS